MKIFDTEYKNIRASGYIMDENKFVILSGSFLIGDTGIQPSLRDNEGRMALRAKLIRDNVIIQKESKYLFTEDFEFNSPSEAASIIWGYNANGRKAFGIDGEIEPEHIAFHILDSDVALEGYKQDQKLSISKRDRELSKKRKEMDNFTCQACNYKMKINGKYIIECHHLNPVSLGGERETTINDLVSLCPTCHRIVHTRDPIYTPDELKAMLTAYNKNISKL